MQPLIMLFLIQEVSRLRSEEVWKNKNRQVIRDFWVNKLTFNQRLDIMRNVQDFVFKHLKEIQNQECRCVICDKKREKLENDIHMLYKDYARELVCFDEQETSMITCQVSVDAEASNLKMTVNIETKDMPIGNDENADIHRQEYYNQFSSIFRLFAARMLDRRIIQRYDEMLILERQTELVQEEEEERRRILERKQRKQQKSESRKEAMNRKRLLKQQEEETLLEEQKKNMEEEEKARKEKEHQLELRNKAKQELREKQRLELEQKRVKSLANLKRRKERDKMLKQRDKLSDTTSSITSSPTILSSPITPSTSSATIITPSSPTVSSNIMASPTSCSSHTSPFTMMSPISTTDFSSFMATKNEDEVVYHHHKSNTYKSPIRCSRLPDTFTYGNNSNNEQHSFFLHSSLFDQPNVSEDDDANKKFPFNKCRIWSNGWQAFNSINKDFHYDLFKDVRKKKSKETIMKEAIHVYSVLDKISFSKYERIPECYALSYLLHMMHELLNDENTGMDDLQQVLGDSDCFICEMKQPHNILTVQLIYP